MKHGSEDYAKEEIERLYEQEMMGDHKKNKDFPDEMKVIDIYTYTFIEIVIVWSRPAQVQGR